jgi:hypothetical protein
LTRGKASHPRFVAVVVGVAGVAGLAVVVDIGGAPDATADETPIALELGARLSFGYPLGNVDAPATIGGASVKDPLDQTAAEIAPVWFDFGFRVASRWYVGLSASIAPGWAGGALNRECASCTLLDLRAGVDVHYHLRPGLLWDPWFGGGLGYEWLNVSESEGTLQASGLELANLQAGLDYLLGPVFSVGPFVALTAAEYSSKSVSAGSTGSPGSESSSQSLDKALHGWFVIGLRGTWQIASRTAPSAP